MSKAIVHVSGTLLRQAWWGKELNSCIIVRPSGREGDTVAYVVNQVRFSGPADMIFGAKPRTTAHDARDKCRPEVLSGTEREEIGTTQGFVGTLNGFDNAILVYLEAEETSIHVQPKQGDEFVRFPEFRRMVESHAVAVPVLNPMLESHC